MNTNARQLLSDACRTHQSAIRRHAVELTKVLRSSIAEFAKRLFTSRA